MRKISRPEKWRELVEQSKNQIENFNDFSEDTAIVWADNQIKDYKRAMLILARSNSNWAMNVSDDDEKLIDTMIRRAEAV